MKRSNLVVFTLVLAALLMSFGSDMVMSQTANIKVIALSPRDIADGGLTSPTSSGLKNVGQGELVYLMGGGASSDTVTAYAWSLEAPLPAGSAAVLDSFTTQMTTFIPDTVGHFVVKLQITTLAGTHDTTITINSAHYVGVGGMETSIPTNTAIGQCGQCHFGNTSEWMGTGHASMLKTQISGLGSAGYASYCISCHVVGYDVASTAVNGGFDDVATALGWTFPATLTPANWDTALVIDRPDLAHLGNIQCENCHGPGSTHFGDPANTDMTLEVGVCAECHDSGSHHIFPMQWANSGHSTAVTSSSSGSCQKCHSSYGFVKSVDNDWIGSDQPGSGLNQITCAACHDPHSAENDHQIRKMDDVTLGNGVVVSGGGYGQLCMNCHISRRDAETYAIEYHSHYGPHHGPQTDMLVGTNAITFGMHIPSSTHSKVIENTCVTCHMADTPASGYGANRVGSHSFAMEAVNDTTGAVTHNVAGCVSCHGAITSFDDLMAKADYDGDGSIESAQHEILGLLDAVGMLLPPLGDPAVSIANTYTTVQLGAAYNYEFVREDRSKGVHNFQYAMNLLKVSHAALTTGDLGAGAISEISDVPNDQGKQVRVVWGGFTGDGIAAMPITNYSLWRRVDVMAKGSLKKDIPIFASREQLLSSDPSNLKIGARVMAGDELWDFAGQVPATGMDSYGAVVSTLYDSTAANGKQLSFFVVTGHTSNPALYFMSAPDSGYSIGIAGATVTGRTQLGSIGFVADGVISYHQHR